MSGSLPHRDGLYRRGIATAVACWERFARGAPNARVHRARGVAAAIFPHGPERDVYNNAPLEPDLGPSARTRAVEAMESAYAAAGVTTFAAWVRDADEPMRAELERRGYRVAETTRAMGMPLDDLRGSRPVAALAPAGLDAHLRVLGAHRGLLAGVRDDGLHVLVGREGGADVATALAFDHDGDCGLFNVVTREGSRRRGHATTLTERHLHDARDRGCRTATLQATAEAERLYAALGFRDLGRILEYTPPRVAARKRTHTSSENGHRDA